MKKINKIIISVVGGLTLFANKGQVTSAAVNNVQRYGIVAPISTPTTVPNYRDSNLNVINNNIRPTAKPSATPTPTISSKPTATPTPKPTPKPTAKPTPKPTAKPTPKATSKSTAKASQGVSGILESIQINISNFFSNLFRK